MNLLTSTFSPRAKMATSSMKTTLAAALDAFESVLATAAAMSAAVAAPADVATPANTTTTADATTATLRQAVMTWVANPASHAAGGLALYYVLDQEYAPSAAGEIALSGAADRARAQALCSLSVEGLGFVVFVAVLERYRDAYDSRVSIRCFCEAKGSGRVLAKTKLEVGEEVLAGGMLQDISVLEQGVEVEGWVEEEEDEEGVEEEEVASYS